MMQTPPEKPTKNYYYALCAKSAAMINEYKDVMTGKKKMTREEKDDWNREKEELHKEIQRVRSLL